MNSPHFPARQIIVIPLWKIFGRAFNPSIAHIISADLIISRSFAMTVVRLLLEGFKVRARSNPDGKQTPRLKFFVEIIILAKK